MALKRRLFSVFAIFLGCIPACSDDGLEDVDVDSFGERPPHYEYTGDEEPSVELPGDEMAWQDVELPLEQSGGDNGDESLTYSAVLGGYYILRVQNDDGSFGYLYHVEEDEWPDENMIHRQCGTTYTQAWMYRVTRRDEFKLSTQRALRYLKSRSTLLDDGTRRLTDIGATALVTLGMTYFAEHSESTEFDETIDQTGAYLLSRLDEDGKFTEGYTLQHGQSMQAFWHLYNYTGEEKYLDALESAGKYLYDHPDEHNWSLYLALWANEPFAELYRLRPAEWITDFTYRMTDPVVERQRTPQNTDKAHWLGGYPHDGESNRPNWNSTLQLELVIDAYRVAKYAGDEERAENYEKSALMASDFLMRLQYREGDTDQFPRPDLVIGALRYSEYNHKLRVDVTHHHANSLIKVVEALDLEDFPGKIDDTE